MTPAPPSAAADLRQSRNELLRGLTAVLTALNERMESQEATKRTIFLLAARAETVAERGWALHAGREPDPTDAATGLAQQLYGLADSFTDMADRVKAETAAARQLGSAMGEHARRLRLEARKADQAGSVASLQLHLKPIATDLEKLGLRQQASGKEGDDAAAVAARMTGLAAGANRLTEALTHTALRHQALTVHYALRSIADDAGEISLAIAAETERLRTTLTAIAASARQLAPAAPGLAAVPAEASVADRVREMMRSEAPPPGPPPTPPAPQSVKRVPASGRRRV
jgi:hypothetical protein